MRDLEIATTEKWDEIGESWKEVIGDREDSFVSITACQFGLAEEVISLLTFREDCTQPSCSLTAYEVGLGEAMRPYRLLYSGADKQLALQKFWVEVQKSAEY